MPTLDESTVKYASGNVVLDRENCGWDRQVGQTVVSFLFVETFPSGPGSHYRGFTVTLTLHSVGLLWTSDQPVAETPT